MNADPTGPRIPFTGYAITIPGLTGHHTAPGHRLEELLDLGRTLHELVGPELERRVLIKKVLNQCTIRELPAVRRTQPIIL